MTQSGNLVGLKMVTVLAFSALLTLLPTGRLGNDHPLTIAVAGSRYIGVHITIVTVSASMRSVTPQDASRLCDHSLVIVTIGGNCRISGVIATRAGLVGVPTNLSTGGSLSGVLSQIVTQSGNLANLEMVAVDTVSALLALFRAGRLVGNVPAAIAVTDSGYVRVHVTVTAVGASVCSGTLLGTGGGCHHKCIIVFNRLRTDANAEHLFTGHTILSFYTGFSTGRRRH